MLGEQFGTFMIAMVDTVLAGQISKEATAAVGTAAYMGWFFMVAFQLLAIGSAALVARLFGERKIKTAERALNQAVLSAAVLGAILSIAVYNAAPLLAGALMQTQVSYDLCVTYLRIDALGFLLASVHYIGAAVLRGGGDTRTPMAVMLIVNVINVFLSLALVYGWFGPELGVLGIAIGTVVAKSVGGLLMCGVLAAGKLGLRLRLSLLRPDFALIWRMARIGLPSFAEAMVMWSANLVFMIFINMTAAGDAATVNYSAHIIAIRLEGITYLPAMAWMTASATMIGQYLGAGQPEKARRVGHIAALQGAALTTGVGIIFFLFAEPIFAGMTSEHAVRAVGAPAFKIMALVQPFLAMGIIYGGSLRGAGDTRWPMVITFFTSVCIRLPGAYIGGVVLDGGLIGAWCGMWADNIIRFLLMLGRYLHGGWRRVKV
ncbi:MAG: MATE family efflux transporter [Planctomycetes bacterium]|nr:MATE family efflux transporter [Planctomycetota bacterium]